MALYIPEPERNENSGLFLNDNAESAQFLEGMEFFSRQKEENDLAKDQFSKTTGKPFSEFEEKISCAHTE